MSDIVEATVTVFVVDGKQYASRAEAIRAATEEHLLASIDQYVSQLGAVKTNATRIRNAVLQWEDWKASQQA